MTKTQIEALATALAWNRTTPPVPVDAVETPRELVLRGYDHAVRVCAMVLLQERKGFDRDRFLKDCGVAP